jgi:cytochrome c peroxidase
MIRPARAVTYSALGALLFGVNSALAADVPDQSYWIAPGQVGSLPAQARYHDGVGDVEVLFAQGSVDLGGNAFFAPLGSNGRACVTCHQPGSGMGLSVEAIRRRWQETHGKDPLFAAIDGSNCPSLPQEQESTHSLLLKRGLFRVSLPWPRTTGPDGSPVDPEFTIEVVRDPTGCNRDPKYGLNSPDPHISVYRRPRVVANLKYLAVDAGAQIFGAAGPFNAKRLAMVMDRDPDTGNYSAMNIMSDAREPTLKMQARDASVDHLQVKQPLTDQQLQSIVSFESQVYAAQGTDLWGDDFSLPSAPPSLGARNLQQSPSGVLGDNFGNPAFKSFASWQESTPSTDNAQASFRASVIRGYDVFFNRPFWIRDVTHINTVGLGNPAKRTCVTCHNLQMVGTDASAGWGDLGTTNEPWADAAISSPTYEAQRPDLPLFKVVCKPEARPHPFLGRVIFTHDPGRALISGKCYDVGSIVMGQLRALAARPPYFASGSAEDLRAVVDYYDRRFNIGLSAQERTDLVNFLSVL